MAAMVHILITCCAVFTLTSVSMAGRPDSAAVVFSDKADAVPGVLPKETVEQKSDPDSVAVMLTEKAVEQKRKISSLRNIIARIWQATVGQVRSRPQGKIAIGQPSPLQPFGKGADDNPTSSLRGKIIVGQPTSLQHFGSGTDESLIGEFQGKILIGQPTPLKQFGGGADENPTPGLAKKIIIGQPMPLQPFGTGAGDALMSGAPKKITLGTPASLRPFGKGGFEGKFVWKGTGTIGRGQAAERPYRIGVDGKHVADSQRKMLLGQPEGSTSSLKHAAASAETMVLL